MGNIWYEKEHIMDPDNAIIPQFPIDLRHAWQLAKRIAPENRTEGATFPIVSFAENATDEAKMPPGIRYLKYRTALCLKKDLLARDRTYNTWRVESNPTLAQVSEELTLDGSVRRTLLFFGVYWNTQHALQVAHLTEDRVQEYEELMGKATVMEILAYYLAVGPEAFARGPSRLVVYFLESNRLAELTTMFVLAQGVISWASAS